MATISEVNPINKTITELAKELAQEQFVQINRSVIVQIEQIKHYAYWKNDKYVLKLKAGKEFTMSQQRLNRIKTE